MPPHKSKKQKYRSKKEINSLFGGVFSKTCSVSMIHLTAEDISNYKLSFIKKKDNTLKEDGSISRKHDTSKIEERSKDDKKSNDIKISTDVKTAKKNTSIDGEPAKKKQKVDINVIDILKLVYSKRSETTKCKSQLKPSLKPSLKPIKEIDSTEEVPMEIDCEESNKSENSSATKVKPSIKVNDMNKIMDADQFTRWTETTNLVQKPNLLINGKKRVATTKLSTSGITNPVKHDLKVKKINRKYLIEIEKLYKKYFCKSVNDTIVIIATITHIIEMSNQYNKERITISLNKRTEAEKLKERFNAIRLNESHKKILETKLKENVKDVLSSFEKSEFDLAFKMFFLSILGVHQILKQSKLKKGNMFKNLVLLLKDSLENSEYPQMFSLFRSKTFQPNCFNLITQIEDSQVIDPGVINRMPLFFEPQTNCLEYFQEVIKAVTTNSREDLAILIDNAASQCSINSIFKDPVDSSTVTETIQLPVNSDEIDQLWILAKNSDGTYQMTAVEKPSNQSFYSPLQEKTYVSCTSKVIPTNKCLIATSTNSHGPLAKATAPLLETTTLMPTATTLASQPPRQDDKIAVNSRLHKTEDSTDKLGVKQYQFAEVSTSIMKAVVNDNNPQTEPTVMYNTADKREPVFFLKCHARNCIKSAVFLCGKCQAVQYCSYLCLNYDLIDCHENICALLQYMRRTQH